MPKKKTPPLSPREQASSTGTLVGFLGFFLGYFVAEAALYGRPHPLHWLVSFSTAALAGIVAYLVVLRRRSSRPDHAKTTQR